MIYLAQLADGKEIEISAEQYAYCEGELENNVSVPLYSTTLAKKKYGDCKIGDIVNITTQDVDVSLSTGAV